MDYEYLIIPILAYKYSNFIHLSRLSSQILTKSSICDLFEYTMRDIYNTHSLSSYSV